MAFNKRTWLGRQGTGLNKFSIGGASPVTIVNQPDSVTQVGDALSAGNLNDLEDRIEDAFDDVDTELDTKADEQDVTNLNNAIENTTIWDIDQQSEVTFEGDGAGTWEIMERQIPTENNDGIFLCMDSSAPSSSSSAGLKGQFYMDANYLYLCIANNTWRRVALSTF